MAEQLGVALLDLGANLAPLDAGLDEAERKVAQKTAVMQAILDSLSVKMDANDARLDSQLAKAAALRSAGGGGVTNVNESSTRSSGGGDVGEVWGIRGPEHPGSLTNPIVTVLEAGKFTTLGSFAAAIGESNTAQSGDNSAGQVLDTAALTAAMEDLARKLDSASMLATAGSQGIGEPGSAERTVIALDDQDSGNLQKIADWASESAAQSAASLEEAKALRSAAMSQDRGVQAAMLSQILRGHGVDSTTAGAMSNSGSGMDDATAAAVGAAAAEAAVSRIMPRGSNTSGAPEGYLTIADAAALLGVQRGVVDRAFNSGRFVTAGVANGFPSVYGKTTRNVISEDELMAAAAEAGSGQSLGRAESYARLGEILAADRGRVPGDLAALLAASGDSTGTDLELALAGGSGGSGGGGGRTVTGGSDSGGFDWRNLLMGNGHQSLWTLGLPLASAGSLGSFAGLGPEHLLLTALGIAGSAGAGLGGAALKGLGSLGTLAVGGGSDAAVGVSTYADVKSLYSAYSALQQAVQEYGKKSQQAAAAQATLNQLIKTGYGTGLSNTAGVQAELGLAKNIAQFNIEWDKTTSHARVELVAIAQQALDTAGTYMPLVVQAAQQNIAMIGHDLQPLFNWLNGPNGIGIFNNLEHVFASQLPMGMSAFDNGVESMLRIIDLAAEHTGGLTKDLDDLFLRLNGESNVQLGNEIDKLVNDAKVWGDFFKALFSDIDHLFSNDVGTGKSIIQELTQMLQELGRWEQSVQGRQDLMTIFSVHKQEIDELLGVIPLLVKAYEPLYMDIAPALTRGFTDFAKVLETIVTMIEKIPGGGFGLGLTWVLAKTGLLATAVGKLRGALLGAGAAEAVSGAGAATAGAEGAVAGAGGGLLGALAGKIGSTGVGTATADLVEGGSLGLASTAGLAGMEGLSGLIAGLGTAVAPLAAVAVPVLGAVGGAYGLIKLIDLMGQGAAPATTTLSSSQLLNRLKNPGALSTSAGSTHTDYSRDSPLHVANTLGDLGSSNAEVKAALATWESQASSATALSKMGIAGLMGMVTAGKNLADLMPQDKQSIDRMISGVQKDLKPLEGYMALMMDRWNADSKAGFSLILGTFDSNSRLIASKLGDSSHQGEMAAAQNINQLVRAMTAGMASGRVTVTEGMNEIDRITTQGVESQALTWQSKTQLITETLSSLYSSGKVSTQQYYADLSQLTAQGLQHVFQTNHAGLVKQQADTKAQFAQGNDGMVRSQAMLNAQLQKQQQQATQNSAADMVDYVSSIVNGVGSAGVAAAGGMNAILHTLNKALSELGQSPVSSITFNAAQLSQLIPSVASGMRPFSQGATTPGAAGGALLQIGRPGEAGRDSVPMSVGGQGIVVAPGEQVAVFNRHQIPVVNGALAMAGYNGLGGLFDSVNTPNYMAAGGIVGNGGFASMAGGTVDMLAKAAASYIGGVGGGISTAGLSGSLIHIVDQISKKKGWNASDWLKVIAKESGGSMTALNKGSGAYGIAQFIDGASEYARYGGNANTLVGQLVAMANYIAGRYGNPTAAWAHEVADNWYAKGGIVGLPSLSTPTFSISPSAVSTWLTGTDIIGGGGPLPFSNSDLGPINSTLSKIMGLEGTPQSGIAVGTGGSALSTSDLISYWTNLWGSSIGNTTLGGVTFPKVNYSNAGSPSSFVITSDQFGNAVNPFIDTTDLGTVQGQLGKVIGWDSSIVGDAQQAGRLTRGLGSPIGRAISRRVAEAAKIRALVRENARKLSIMAKIKANLAKIKANNAKIRKLKEDIKLENSRKHPDKAYIQKYASQIASLTGENVKLEGQIATWQRELGVKEPYTSATIGPSMSALQAENMLLAGDKDSVGTGGELGTIMGQLGSPGSGSAIDQALGTNSSAGGLYALQSMVSGWNTDIGGTGGMIDLAANQLGLDKATLKGLSQTTLAGFLSAAQANAASSTGTSSADSSDLTSLLQQQNTTLAEANSVLTAQYSVLANFENFPPFAGAFATGGVVPGPMGAARMALVHGGEVITPVGAGPAHVHVHVHTHGGAENFIRATVQDETRKQAKAAIRPRAGQNAGRLTLR